MQIKEIFAKLKKKREVAAPQAEVAILKDWYRERYESTVIQRNVLFLLSLVLVVTVAASAFIIRYIRNTKSIEPFIIEIERKTGVPTVVNPVNIKVYSSDKAIKQYFIWKYIKAREEYTYVTYLQNFKDVVRVLSAPNVYFGDYRGKYSMNNPTSPYNLYGQASIRTVQIKSIIFTSDNSAQVRLSMNVTGAIEMRTDKVALIEFDFADLEMSLPERLINPLGFRVKFYRIEDERAG
jgi:type IV secretion system protein VirB8